MCAVVTVFSFSQFRAARDQVVNSLVEAATQSTFLLLKDIVMVPACWDALTLGCDDKNPQFLLDASCF